MFRIICIHAGIQSLAAHRERLAAHPDDYRPVCCPYCHHTTLHRHGCYYRLADRTHTLAESLNPVAIPRYRCARCRSTCSMLPQCLPPRRWYEWSTQQQALQGYLAGHSYRQLATTLLPSRTTIARWIAHFKQRWPVHADGLRQQITCLRLTQTFNTFWQTCLSQLSLSASMFRLHQAHISIP